MALTNMMKIMNNCRAQGKGCGSFSTYSMEGAMGIVKAAEETGTPIIIQLAEGRFSTAPLEFMGPMMMNAAKTANVDIAVHLDHGKTEETVRRCLELGFTSVMYDGSHLPIEENMENTLKVIEIAKQYGADVEAELGVVGRSENGFDIQYTRPEDAKLFVETTDVDALAVGIGNLHGNYPGGEPHLRLDILQQIHEAVPEEHLVLHGGSGISDSDFQNCIRRGITKININTAMLNRMVENATKYLTSEDSYKCDYYGLNKVLVAGAYEAALHHMNVFNMKPIE